MHLIISQLIAALSSTPGLSVRAATRAVAHMLNNREASLLPVGNAINNVINNVKRCEVCWDYSASNPCDACSGSNKCDRNQICIVEDVSALWSIQRSRGYGGMYHVLGGLLSVLDGVSAKDLNLDNLMQRIAAMERDKLEIIIAIPSSVAADITVEYILSMMREVVATAKISRIAQGLPSGARIDSMDGETVAAAFKARCEVA
jgi:recombination protein RecR